MVTSLAAIPPAIPLLTSSKRTTEKTFTAGRPYTLDAGHSSKMKLPKAKEGAPLSTDALPNLLEMPIQDLRNLLVDGAVSKMPAHPPVQESVMAKQVDIDMIDLAENNCQWPCTQGTLGLHGLQL